MRHAIQPAFSGDFATMLGDEANILRADLQGDGHNILGNAHLQIQLRGDLFSKQENVSVLNVTAVFAKMGGDPDGARFFGNECGRHGIWLGIRVIRRFAVAGLAQCGDMVDVDSKTWHRWFQWDAAGRLMRMRQEISSTAPGASVRRPRPL